MVMLGTSLRRRRSAQASRVTRDSGRSLAPYPPTTVSLWTKPSTPLRSASTTRIRDSVGSADRDPAGAHRRSGARGRLLRLRTLAAVRGGQPYAGGGLLPIALGVLDRDLRSGTPRDVFQPDAPRSVPHPRVSDVEG